MPTAATPKSYALAIARAVRICREACDLSVAEAAARAGVNRVTLHTLERTGRGSLALLVAVAEALETTPAKLLTRAEVFLAKSPRGH